MMRNTNFFFVLFSTVVVLGTTSMGGSSDGLCCEERERERERERITNLRIFYHNNIIAVAFQAGVSF